MSRFKVSKYRNALPAVAKKEQWVHDLSVGTDPRSYSSANLIKASCEHVAFISDFRSKGSVSVLPINSFGRNTSFPHVSGHSGMLTDFDFSYFDGNLLATCGEDGLIKLWNAAELTSLSSFGPFKSSVESLKFHPQVDNLLAFAEKNSTTVFDLQSQKDVYSVSQANIQSICWSGDGSLVGTIAKSDKRKCVTLYDPRQKKNIQEFLYHSHLKGSYITWMGDKNQFITTGHDQSKGAEIALWSLSNTSKPVYTACLGNGSGVPLVFYDEDTCMVYACMKGETSVSFFELQDKDPYLSIGPNSYSGREQIKGLCCVPKQAVNVMECEVDRLLILSQSAIIPLSFVVQRKSHTEFHGDLYPDTAEPVPAASIDEWLTGSTAQRKKISMDPAKRQSAAPVTNKSTKTNQQKVETSIEKAKTESVKPKENNMKVSEKVVNPTSSITSEEQPDSASDTNSSTVTATANKKQINIVRSSKVRFIEGKILHKDLSIYDIPKLSTALTVDSNGFTGNEERFACYLSGAGGQLGVYEIKDTGRMNVDKLLKIENGCSVMDFTFDPFDSRRLAVALDNAVINIWNIPKDITDSIKPLVLSGHYEKITTIAFHPQAKDVLASSSYDQKIIIWDLSTLSSKIILDNLPELVHSLAWSCDGKYLATLSRDCILRLYDPRTSSSPVKEGQRPADSKGGRLIWLNNDFLLSTGFNKSHNRLINLFSSSDLSCLSTLLLDVNPSPLVPYFDPDINVIFLTGKGDSMIFTVEFDSSRDPFLYQTASFKCPSAHQGVVFLPKTLCDVKAVQVERGMRLCNSSVEQFIFTIPRVKKEYFQDDLYPPTVNWWKPALVSSEWFSGKDKEQEKTPLCPPGMKPLSEAPQQVAAPKKYASYDKREKTDNEKKEELITAMMGKMGGYEDEKLPQEDADGVDSDEWDD